MERYKVITVSKAHCNQTYMQFASGYGLYILGFLPRFLFQSVIREAVLCLGRLDAERNTCSLAEYV